MQSVAAGTIYMAFFSTLSKILGFFREMIVAFLFGTSRRLDGIVISLDPVGLAVGLIAGSMSTVFIPFYHELRSESEDTRSFSGSVLIFISLIYLMIGSIFVFFPNAIVKIFAPGFDEETLNYTVRKMRYVSILVVINALQQLVSALLRAERRFKEFALAGLVFNFISIPVLVIGSKLFGEASYILAWITGQFFVLMLELYFAKDLIRFDLRFDRRIKELFRRTLPLTMLYSVTLINPIVDRIFASYLPGGRIASLRYAMILIGFINSIIGYFTLASYTELSERFVDADREKIEDRMFRTVKSSLNVAVPASAWVLSMSGDLVALIFQRGRFTVESTSLVDAALLGYVFLIVLSPIARVTNDYLVLKKAFKTLFFISVGSVALNAFFDWIFMKPFSHAGIALSTSGVVLVFTIVRGFIVVKDGFRFMPWRRFFFLLSISVPPAVIFFFLNGITKLIVGNVVFAFIIYVSAKEEISFVLSKIVDRLKR